ncbi:MAG: two-component regulator propeller domain-containing protein [Ignavibacterium sp.]
MLKKAVLLFLILPFTIIAQNIEFRNYTVRDGLSNNKVNCVIQDRQGFLWFGCEDGLNRFDGYEFKVFRSSDRKNSISSKDIWSLYEDREGNIWIGTKSGEVNKLDFKTKKISHWKIQEVQLNDNSVTAIYVDKKNFVWVGTYQQGLFKFDSAGNKIGHWEYNPENERGISNNFITSIVEDRFGKIWVSTYFGLNEFDPLSPEKGFNKYISPDKSINNNLIWEIRSSIDSNNIWICGASGLSSIDIQSKKINHINIPPEPSIQFSSSVGDVVETIENKRRIIYVGTYGGLVRIDLESGLTERFTYNSENVNGIISNQINQMTIDKSGVIWLATENGVSSLSLRYNFFSPLLNKVFTNQKVFNSEVKAISIDDDENILIGTSKGLYRLNLKNFAEAEIPNTANLNIWSLLKDQNDIWIGTYGQGLFRFNLKTNMIRKIKIEYPLFQTQSYNFIKSLTDDGKGNIYIGTWGGGVVRINKQTEQMQFWRSNKNIEGSISHNDVWSILIDKIGRIWIATNGGGINLFDPFKNKFYTITSGKIKGQLKSNSILSIHLANESSDDLNGSTVIWICHDYGLTKLKLSNKNNFNDIAELIISTKNYDSNDGLLSEVVKSLIEGENENLWVSTSNGIFIYDKKSDKFNPIPFYLERRPTDYSSGASFYLNNKFFLFGSNEGLKIFSPSDILSSDYKPEIIISDFQIFNNSVYDDPEKYADLFSSGEIVLPYSQNVFSFTFSSTDYNNPASIKYAYMMKGFDKDWIYSDSRRFVTYTNLNPGDYEFLVKATNSDGVWNNNPASVKIKINPPWWRTPWAYAGFIIVFVAGIILIRRLELNKAKLLNNLRMKEFEAEKLREVEAMKSRFFANISHELRTPLMLIKGPIDELMNKDSGANVKELAELAARNSEKLKTLIDQLLELTQLESAKISVKASSGNIVEFSKNIFNSFKSFAANKDITSKFDAEQEEITACFDQDILEKVLNNLLSNAFKFTPENGTVGLRLYKRKNNLGETVNLAVYDTGIGIDEKNIDKIFDRFYQATDSQKKNYSGFGIGLSLIKEFIDLHKWKIEVKSRKGEGSEFTITIPLYEYLDDSEKSKAELAEAIIQSEDQESIVPEFNSESASDVDNNRPTLMIVEDSEDVQFFLSTILKNQYNLILAKNGVDALEKSVEDLPDLIISDIMMPEMDGLEFCKRIKSDWKTSHIPVILLTARITVDNKVEGLEFGADDYITKPFNSRELTVRIKNLLEQRKKLKEIFSSSVEMKPGQFKFSPEENEFVQNAIKVVEENIDNPDFDTEKFAERMFLSRSQLHRKLIQLTNESPGEFIRTLRLKHAAKLLLQKNFNITQIALEVGFNSPSHFTKAFKQFFNCTPKEFIQKEQ